MISHREKLLPWPFLIHWPVSVLHLVWFLASPETLHLKLQLNHHYFAVIKSSSLLKQLQPRASYKPLWASRAVPQSDTTDSAITLAFKACCSPLIRGRQCVGNSHPPFGAQPHSVQGGSSKLFRPNSPTSYMWLSPDTLCFFFSPTTGPSLHAYWHSNIATTKIITALPSSHLARCLWKQESVTLLSH